MSATGTDSHTTTITAGQYKKDIGTTTTLTTYCNDSNGFEIYAKGISSNTVGQETDLVNSTNTANNIHTGIATTGNTSSWGMKVSPVAGTYAPVLDITTINPLLLIQMDTLLYQQTILE